MRKPKQSQDNSLAVKAVRDMMAQRLLGKQIEVVKAKETPLPPSQDTVFYSQDFMNKWSKIEALTTKQIKKGMKGVQPDFSDHLGREGIVRTHHETCWVCEKRKYVLLAVNMDPTNQKKTWGLPIRNLKEHKRLCKKYVFNGQMPTNLNYQPILVSSINDWLPVHLMPVVPFAMLFDYSLVSDLAKDAALKRDTQDSVAKFKEGYN